MAELRSDPKPNSERPRRQRRLPRPQDGLPQPSQPLRGDDPSRFQRLSEIQRGMRSYINHFRAPSSLYSTPNAHLSMVNGPAVTPKPGFRRFFGAWGEESHSQSRDHLPLNAQDDPLAYSPARQPSEWADEPMGGPQMTALPPMPGAPPRAAAVSTNPNGLEMPTVSDVTEETEGSGSRSGSRSGSGSRSASSGSRDGQRRHKRRRHHRHHHQDEAWVRRHRPGTRPRRRQPLHEPGHSKYLPSIVSGLFLVCIVATYLAIALSVKGVGQELHIIFLLTIVGASVFFLHTLIRLYLRRKPNRPSQRRHRIPSVASPEGFKPDVPVRVHLNRDEEIGALDENGDVIHEKLENLKAPPPAYGLWRCSVKVDPSLLHWKKVDASATEAGSSSQGIPEEQASSSPQKVPRPPSYLSDDGVGYVVEAQPRSTVFLQRPPTELHPAYHQPDRLPQ